MNVRKLIICIGVICSGAGLVKSQNKIDTNAVTPLDMQLIYSEIKTPFKYGMVMIHSDTSSMIDCATIFRKDDIWYMSYLVYDGKGYETWLAKSDNLLEWETVGTILPYIPKGSKDWNQSAGYPALIDYKWGGSYELQSFQDKYWMSYFGSSSEGYERGKLCIGMAYTEQSPDQAHDWSRMTKPVLNPDDEDAGTWESDKLYKSSVIWDKSKSTGKEFVMYYNAVGDTSTRKNWVERIGMATSDDMINWERYENNPILDHRTGLTGDAIIQKYDSIYIMFYYGAFWPEERKDAFNSFACSYDLIHWTDWTGEDLIRPSEIYDSKYAHKPCVIKSDGIVYHFYTAVNDKEQRGLAVATSRDLGKSELNFMEVKNKLKR